MNLLLKHITRNMEENMGRTLLIMLSLFIVSILIAIISVGILYINILDDAFSKLGSYDYVVQSTTGREFTDNTIKDMKEKFDIYAFSDLEYGSIQDKDGNYISAELLGTNIKDLINFKFTEINEDNVELNENESLITSEIAEKYDLKKGNEFEYYGQNGKKNILKVKYIVEPLRMLNEKIKIITNEETYLKIADEDNISYIILFVNKKSDDITSEEIEKIETELGVSFIENNNTNLETTKREILYIGVIVSILLFAVIFVSLNSIVKIIINERIPVIGTFRSIGITKKQIISVLFTELLMYTIIPSLLGALAGIGIIKGISSFTEMMLNSFGSTEKINIVEYIFPISMITISITILFQMLLSMSELIKVSRMSIKDSIFNNQTSKYKYSIIKIIFGVFFLTLGIITVMKHKQLTYWYCLTGILSIFMSIALIVPTISKLLIKILEKSKNPIIIMATNTLKNSSLQINTNIIFVITVSVSLVTYSFFNYSSTIEKSKQNAVNADLYVEEIGASYDTIYDKTNEFYKLENVKSVSSILDITVNKDIYDEIKFANHSIKEVHLVYSENYQDLMKDCNLLNVDVNSVNNLKKYEIIVSDYYKDIYGLKQGDTIVLKWKTIEENFEPETPINLKIVGFTDLSKIQNNTIIVSAGLGKELNTLLFNGFSNAKYFINLKDNNSEAASETRKTIIKELGIKSNGTTGNVFTKTGYINSVKENSKSMMRAMTITVIVIVGLSLVGIVNNQIVSFMERRRELATLYSIAMSRKQLKNMILIENMLAFVISTITSLVFYIIISKLVEYTLQILLIPISIKFTISGVLILLLIVTMILLEIQKSMREHIKNMNIVEEIKYE